MARRCPCTSARFRFPCRSRRSTPAETGTQRTSPRGRPPSAPPKRRLSRLLMRDLHLTHLRAVLIIDDEDVQSVLAMLHHLSGDNQGVPSPCPSAAPWSPRAAEGAALDRPRAPISHGRQSDVKGMVGAQSSTAVDLGEPWPFEPA